ncbi:HpcH/HpaI aldolase family protein [Mycobacterium sp. C31M]
MLEDVPIPLGTIISGTRDLAVVELVATVGFDFVWLDMQHAAVSIETLADMCRVARLAGVVPIVRPDMVNGDWVHKLLDVGAQGIVFFDVRTAAQIKEYREWVRRPDGTQAALITQIESREALDNVRSILEEGRPDMVQIGRHDLSTDLGAAGDMRDPLVLNAIDEIVKAAGEFGVPVAAGAYGREDAEDLLARGVRCLHYSSDIGLLLAGYKSGLAWLKELTEGASR